MYDSLVVTDLERYALSSKFADWFSEYYPDDCCIDEVNPDVTFRELLNGLENESHNYDVYEAIGVGDSEVRIALFMALCEITHKDYDYFYNLWCHCC